MNTSYDGVQCNIRQLDTPKIDVWTNEYKDRDYTIEITNTEFTSVCPKTGLPDFAEIRLTYIPDKFCVELRSFKEYFIYFRDVGIFHEHVVNKVLDDFVLTCQPRSVDIIGYFNIRGGIKTVVQLRYSKDKI